MAPLIFDMYFDGTLYATVSDGEEGEQSLLDSSFPDVANKARGYTLGSAPHSFYKKFSVWEGSPPADKPMKQQWRRGGGDSSPATSDNGNASPGRDGAGAGGKQADGNSSVASRNKDSDEREESSPAADLSGSAMRRWPFQRCCLRSREPTWCFSAT